MAAGFASLGLATPQHALGLPEGSIRALIALFLIMIFIMVSIHLFRTVSGRTGVILKNLTSAQIVELGNRVADIEQNQAGTFDVTLRTGITAAGEQLALQLATILGTLVAAVSAFYFGTTTVASAQRAAETSRAGLPSATSTPSIDNITPNSGSVAQEGLILS